MRGYICVWIHMNITAYVSACVSPLISAFVRTCTCICVYVSACAFVYVCMCIPGISAFSRVCFLRCLIKPCPICYRGTYYRIYEWKVIYFLPLRTAELSYDLSGGVLITRVYFIRRKSHLKHGDFQRLWHTRILQGHTKTRIFSWKRLVRKWACYLLKFVKGANIFLKGPVDITFIFYGGTLSLTRILFLGISTILIIQPWILPQF